MKDASFKPKFKVAGFSCAGCVLLWVILGLTLGAVCTHYALNFWVGVDTPWYACMPIGMVTSGFVLPAGAITFAFDKGGVKPPVWPLTDEAKAKKAAKQGKATPAERN